MKSSGSRDIIRLDSRLQFMAVPPLELQPQITWHPAVRSCDANNRRTCNQSSGRSRAAGGRARAGAR